jgi:hypothetical protein
MHKYGVGFIQKISKVYTIKNIPVVAIEIGMSGRALDKGKYVRTASILHIRCFERYIKVHDIAKNFSVGDFVKFKYNSLNDIHVATFMQTMRKAESIRPLFEDRVLDNEFNY